ncbi:class I SAM-dependent methyltransferase [bacterium]|jgi:SAM-dependent methyltransferase|nr:class I SAM-dependent methyltransferase [bacterium]
MNRYKYNEQKTSLDSRINAHSNFSNFNLHDWISLKFNIKKGDNILDIGCGNGNYTELFFSKTLDNGIIYGLDKNEDLINDANNRHGDLSKKIFFKVADYDLISDINTSFDWIFSIYSLYYTANSKALIDKLKRMLSNNGKFVIIGPASQNALDLDDFHYSVTGSVANPEHRLRNQRIESDFLLIFKSIFRERSVNLEIIDSTMIFPTINDYAEYYWSTLLWREGIENLSPDKIEALKNKTLDLLSEQKKLKIKKQLSCLVGSNS